MHVKNFRLSLGWLEIGLNLRFGRPIYVPLRRYRPTSRHRIERARDQLLRQLADTFSPDRSP